MYLKVVVCGVYGQCLTHMLDTVDKIARNHKVFLWSGDLSIKQYIQYFSMQFNTYSKIKKKLNSHCLLSGSHVADWLLMVSLSTAVT